jgi:hypothetical protein
MAENLAQRIPKSVQQAFDAVMAFQWSSTDQPFRERINNSAEQESRSTTPLRLNEHGLTSGMLAACIDSVSELRDHFLHLHGAFDTAIHSSKKNTDALQDIDKQIASKQQEYEQTQASAEKKHETDKYKEMKDKVARLDKDYMAMYRAEGQRKAKDFSLIAYITLLLGVGATEWMVNYETFLNFLEVPLMAAGTTILVATAVAVTAHYHGTMFKGHQHFFGDHVASAKKNPTIGLFVLCSFFLLLAFGVVGGARYLLVASQVSQLGSSASSGLLGGDVVTINVGQVVTVSVAINIFVWFVGAAIAYAVHDENPDFTRKFREYKKAKKIYDPLRRAFEMEISQLHSKREKEITELKNTARAHEQEDKPLVDLWETANERKKKIEPEADLLTNRLIRTYRSALADLAAVDNPELKFNKSGELIDIESYRQLAIDFSFQNQLGELA